MPFDAVAKLADLKVEIAELKARLEDAVAAGDRDREHSIRTSIDVNLQVQGMVWPSVLVAQRTSASVDDDDHLGLELTVHVRSVPGAEAVCQTKVIYDARCAVAMLLCEEDFNTVVANAKLKVRPCDGIIGDPSVSRAPRNGRDLRLARSPSPLACVTCLRGA